ncbi:MULTISPECIES: ROK family protein [unclassified Microbacterium]|uniref:ROK family protein n=1 Tax=Microbacterium TaxID=33882 RepID=UPI003B9EE544
MAHGTANSPQVLRRMNSGAVVRFALRVAEFTAAEVMAETSLTRATVLGVCDDLVEAGWLVELEDSRAAGLTSKGRPARRYRLRDEAGVVAGIDAGEHRFTAIVADLRGKVLGEVGADAPAVDRRPGSAAERSRAEAADERRALSVRLLDEALAAAGARRDDLLVVVVGVPAPVDADGRSPAGDRDYWKTMNPGFADALPGPSVVVENDANLAAVAEQSHDAQAHTANVATLLSGERLGAGVIVDGRLLRGARGGAGEMRFLDIVEGAGSPDGVGALARMWAQDAVAHGERSALAELPVDEITARDVFRAAADGDALAAGILDRLGDRIARVALVLASLLDIERVVIAGAIAEAIEPVLARARTVLAEEFYPPVPELVASTLGRDIVVRGAVESARARIREEPLAFEPRR